MLERNVMKAGVWSSYPEKYVHEQVREWTSLTRIIAEDMGLVDIFVFRHPGELNLRTDDGRNETKLNHTQIESFWNESKFMKFRRDERGSPNITGEVRKER